MNTPIDPHEALRRSLVDCQRRVDESPLDLRARIELAQVLRRLGRESDAREELAVVAQLSGAAGEAFGAVPGSGGLQRLARAEAVAPLASGARGARPIPPQARVARPLPPGEEGFDASDEWSDAPLEEEEEGEVLEVGDRDIVAVTEAPRA